VPGHQQAEQQGQEQHVAGGAAADRQLPVQRADVSGDQVQDGHDHGGQHHGPHTPALEKAVAWKDKRVKGKIPLEQGIGEAERRTVQELLPELPAAARGPGHYETEQHDCNGRDPDGGLPADLDRCALAELDGHPGLLPRRSGNQEPLDVAPAEGQGEIQAGKQQEDGEKHEPEAKFGKQDRGENAEVGQLVEPQGIEPDACAGEQDDEKDDDDSDGEQDLASCLHSVTLHSPARIDFASINLYPEAQRRQLRALPSIY
jgi:hypothetical protein